MSRLLRYFVILLEVAILCTSRTHAQDFYPIETGNTWNYTVLQNNFPNPSDSASVQFTVLNDTLMPNGRVYGHLSSRDVLGATFVRADSNFVYYYSTSTGTEVAMYNLRAPRGTIDTMRWEGLFSSQVSFIGKMVVFGAEKTIRFYTFDGLVQLAVTLAEGFGIIDAVDYADGAFPYAFMWTLRGAVIRDTLHGIVLHTPGRDGGAREISVHQNFPNPFNSGTTIRFELPRASVVQLCVYDLLGREVSVLVNDRKDTGVHEVRFDGSGLASGVYFYRLTVGDFVQTRKLVLIR